MDGDIILPETDATDFIEPIAPNHKKTKMIVLGIVSVIALIGLIVALIVVIINKNPDSKPPTNNGTSEDSSKYDSQKFNDAMTLAEERLGVKDYVGAEYYLKEYSSSERMSPTQKYRYYTIMATLYSKDNLNDPELATKYAIIAKEALKSIRKGEE
jgi:flagellar basal body-associated protein FliL